MCCYRCSVFLDSRCDGCPYSPQPCFRLGCGCSSLCFCGSGSRSSYCFCCFCFLSYIPVRLSLQSVWCRRSGRCNGCIAVTGHWCRRSGCITVAGHWRGRGSGSAVSGRVRVRLDLGQVHSDYGYDCLCSGSLAISSISGCLPVAGVLGSPSVNSGLPVAGISSSSSLSSGLPVSGCSGLSRLGPARGRHPGVSSRVVSCHFC